MDVGKTVPHGARTMPVKRLRVEVVAGPDAPKTAEGSDRLSIGTDERNDLVLTDDTVSRFHVELSREGSRVAVADYGSTNGTLVGGASLRAGWISPGTVMKLGRSEVRLTEGSTVDVEVFPDEQLEGLVGRSPAMRQLMARIRRAAASDASIVILGETGSGKEVVAHTIHKLSARADQPFETVDCGSVIPTLIASELFGHEQGAFTGADRQHLGAFERADGGTLFLDEVGELPGALQVTLLGALERRSFRRLGGKDRIDVDVRVIAATNRELREEVNTSTFRADLYFRLAVVQLVVPPLRDRPEDIPLLVEHFLRQSGYRGPVDDAIDAAAMELLTKHRWPGNVRELRNVVEATLVMGEPPALDATSATAERIAGAPALEPTASDESAELPFAEARQRAHEAFEKRYVTDLLGRLQGNVSRASRVAGMHRSYLNKLLKRHGIKPDRD